MTGARRPRGRLVAVEGIDGSGKSTFAPALVLALRRRGWSVALRREPNDRALGALAQTASVHDPWTGGVYFTLDRLLARPALEKDLGAHDLVVTDRSFYSTLAYQGSALGAALARRLDRLQRGATVVPGRVILLEISPAVALRRLGTRSARRAPLERRATLERVARAYRRLARSPRWVVLDARVATGPAIDLALGRLERWLGPPPRRARSGSRRRRT
jgi:dTMP kinase